MIKLQEGDIFFYSDSLPNDWPVYVAMQYIHTNTEEKTETTFIRIVIPKLFTAKANQWSCSDYLGMLFSSESS